MSERLSDIAAHIASVERLGSVVSSMRGIASARARQAGQQLRAVDDYSTTIRAALTRTLTLMPPSPHLAGPPTLVLFLAEQGFVGAFSDKVLDALPAEPPRIWMVGTRGLTVAAERGLTPWRHSAMPARSEAIPRAADAMARALLADTPGPIEALFPVTNSDGRVTTERLRLFPLAAGDTAPGADSTTGTTTGTTAAPPLLNLSPAELLVHLMAEALHAGLCRAALHATAAENMARMVAMGAAQQQTEKKLEELRARERLIRQETITSEIIELAAGETAARDTREETS